MDGQMSVVPGDKPEAQSEFVMTIRDERGP
jgi:hypothetical protein